MGDARPVALTRDISPAIAECELTHLDRATINLERARAQHDGYERVLATLGYEVRRLAAGDDQPDSVFIEDTAIVLDEVAIVTRPGAASRRAETAAVASVLREYRRLEHIGGAATIDGGDVLRAGRRLFVGLGGRTNRDGLEQLHTSCAPYGYETIAVSFQGCLHLKTAATLVDDDLLLINPAWVEADRFDGLHTLPVHPTEPFGANALLARQHIVHDAQFERTRRRLEAIGLRVLPVPASELAKAEAGVTCCSLLVDPP